MQHATAITWCAAACGASCVILACPEQLPAPLFSLPRRAPPPQRDPPRLAQAYNIFQLPLAAAAKKRAQPVVAAEPAPTKGAGQDTVCRGVLIAHGTQNSALLPCKCAHFGWRLHHALAGPAKKKVRWSDEQEEQQKQDGTMKVAGGSMEGSSTRRSRKAPPAGKVATGGGKASAAPAPSPSKENVVLPDQGPVALPAGKMAAASKKQGKPRSGAAGGAARKTGGQDKGRAKTLLRRMQKSLSKTG